MDFSNVTCFIAGDQGCWKMINNHNISGVPLPSFDCLEITQEKNENLKAAWILKGVSSNIRYTTKDEIDKLKAIQPGLGRPEATLSAMIPIKKSEEWWNLAQDERRRIIEDQSGHIKEGMNFLPGIARKLYHSKDLGQPFDFITWFEFAPEHEKAFDALLSFLRNSEEWKYVIREVDLRFRLNNLSF